MARIKNEAEDITEKSLQTTITEEAPIIELTGDKIEGMEENAPLKTLQEPTPQIIPDNINKILKMYTGYEELYIDNKGGAYTIQYPNAHLYQNPYHKK